MKGKLESLSRFGQDNCVKYSPCERFALRSKIQTILRMYGHSADWERQLTDLSGYISHTKENIYIESKYIDDWFNSIQNSVANPTLRTSKLFQTEFPMVPYVTHVKHPQIRRPLSKFKTSSHMPRIGTGRHQKPKLKASQRTCLSATLIILMMDNNYY